MKDFRFVSQNFTVTYNYSGQSVVLGLKQANTKDLFAPLDTAQQRPNPEATLC